MSTEPQPTNPSSNPPSEQPVNQPPEVEAELPQPPASSVPAQSSTETPSTENSSAKTSSATTSGNGQTWLRLTRQFLGIVATTISLALNLLIKVLKWLWATWNFVLPKLRALLPEPWKTRLPNQIFTAIAIALLLLIVSVPSLLSPDRPAAIAQSDQPVPAEQPKSAPAVDTVKLVKIQEKVTEVADQYAMGLVQSIQTNSRQSRLTVKVDDTWYALLPDQQDKLANDVLKRSHRLKFDQLELTDTKDKLVARSPVVGSTMLVLERTKLIEETEAGDRI
jgi:hypothetical protein